MGKTGNPRWELQYFIENIPDEKLKAFPSKEISNVHNDDNYRLDMQSVCVVDIATTSAHINRRVLQLTSNRPYHWNIQIQINRQSTIASLKRIRGQSVTKALVPAEGNGWTAEEVGAELLKIVILASSCELFEWKEEQLCFGPKHDLGLEETVIEAIAGTHFDKPEAS